MTKIIITGEEKALKHLFDRMSVRRMIEDVECEFVEEDLTSAVRFDKYQEFANRTSGAGGEKTIGRLLCASLGLTGEAGELGNKVKKMVYHSHPDVEDAIREEVGDCIWYIAEICSTFGWKMEEVAIENIQKLAKRYPKGFTYEDSQDRDI